MKTVTIDSLAGWSGLSRDAALHVVTKAAAGRQAITIRVGGKEHASLLLGADKNALYLDMPIPPMAVGNLKQPPCMVSWLSREDGFRYGFVMQQLRFGVPFAGHPAVAVPFPDPLRRVQMRAAYRVTPAQEDAGTLRIEKEGAKFGGMLLNISTHGLGACIPRQEDQTFPGIAPKDAVALHFSLGTQVLTGIPGSVIRAKVETLKNGAHVFVLGIEFANPGQDLVREIERYAVARERAELAKKRR